MKSLLIAVESAVMSQQLYAQLSPNYRVYQCQNGLEAAELLSSIRPDVLVVDLMLPGIDGITLLQLARSSGVSGKILALSCYISSYIVSALEQLDVDYLMRMDCDLSHLVSKVTELAQGEEEIPYHHDVRQILTQLGFRLHTAGYAITEQAICLYAQNPNQKITTQLYPRVAESCGGTVTQVEKAIRSSVESAWKSGSSYVWRMYFPAGKNGKTVKPTNGDFLVRIARCALKKEGNIEQYQEEVI